MNFKDILADWRSHLSTFIAFFAVDAGIQLESFLSGDVSDAVLIGLAGAAVRALVKTGLSLVGLAK